MLWPIVLPFQVTLCVLAGFVALVTACSPALKWKRGKAFLVSAVLACVAFLPSCMGIMAIMDAQRFGVFEYDSFSDVNDFRVERYLPPAASSITLDKYPQGFRARFTISESDLKEYLDDIWEKYGDLSVVKRGEMHAMKTVDRESHKLLYGDLGWEPLEEATEYHSPTAANGAGFSVWYSPKNGIAHQRAGYW